MSSLKKKVSNVTMYIRYSVPQKEMVVTCFGFILVWLTLAAFSDDAKFS